MRHGHCKISPLCPRTEPEEDDEEEGLFRANAVNEEEEEEEGLFKLEEEEEESLFKADEEEEQEELICILMILKRELTGPTLLGLRHGCAQAYTDDKPLRKPRQASLHHLFRD